MFSCLPHVVGRLRPSHGQSLSVAYLLVFDGRSAAECRHTVLGLRMHKFDSSKWLADHADICNVRAVTFDINGVMRGKRLPIEQLKKAVNGALALKADEIKAVNGALALKADEKAVNDALALKANQKNLDAVVGHLETTRADKLFSTN